MGGINTFETQRENMDRLTAKQLNEKVFELVESCLSYEASYGGGQPRHESPEAAWQAAQIIEDKQVEILHLLDIAALRLGPQRIKGISGFDYFMSSKLAGEMVMFAAHLIIYCIQAEFGQSMADAIINHQRLMINMIDPKAYRERMKNENEGTNL
jgi:hypothetical protein